MHLTLRLLGRELLHVEVDQAVATKPERAQLEANGGGQFEIAPFGFDVGEEVRDRATTVPRR